MPVADCWAQKAENFTVVNVISCVTLATGWSVYTVRVNLNKTI